MKRPLRVLLVEDNEDDADLLLIHLKKGGFDPVCERVETLQAMKTALSSKKFDIVISDYKLPHFSGRDALSLLKENRSDTPFIIVSGTIGEESAVEIMKAGASDYIMKNNLKRLVPAIERELIDARIRRERKQAEEKLIESEENYRNVVENIAECVFAGTVGENMLVNHFELLSKQIEDMLGYSPEDFLAQPELWPQIIHPDDLSLATKNARQAFEKNIPITYTCRMKHKTTGEYRWIERTIQRRLNAEGRVGTFFGTARDITEQKRAEEEKMFLQEQLRQAKKIESLGALAGGIAHDFNNVLGIVLGYASIISRGNMSAEKLSKSVDVINTAVQRGVNLVRQLLTFARKTDVLFEPVMVNNTIEELAKMLGATFPKTIVLDTQLDRNLPVITADSSQVYQALLNLCINARDAMPDGGKISISTKTVPGTELRERFADAESDLYMEISVSDTGVGMNEETRERIFEPFFTTKETGKGTGLGLSVVHGVVKSHQGFIDLESELGKGTTFHLYFPVKHERTASTKVEQEQPESIPGGNETIFLIEDEEALRDLIRTLLELRGYKVFTAKDGGEAVEVYKLHHDEIAFVLSDSDLPGQTGLEAFLKMKQINPAIKLVFASGFVDPSARTEMMENGALGIIQKPYDPAEVLRTIRKILDN